MGKKPKPAPSPPPADPPQIYEASLGAHGAVIKGPTITSAQAEIRRQNGQDVLVGGGSQAANRALAGMIERSANGNVKRCPPHASAGPHSLPHYQPDPRPPEGHTFYETPNRKAH